MSDIELKLTRSNYKFHAKLNELGFNDKILRIKKFETKINNSNKIKKAIMMPISKSLISLKREIEYKNNDIKVFVNSRRPNKDKYTSSKNNQIFIDHNFKSTSTNVNYSPLKQYEAKKFDYGDNYLNAILGSSSVNYNVPHLPIKTTIFRKYHTKSNSFNEYKAAILPKIENNTLIVDNYNLLWKISHNNIDTKIGNRLLHAKHSENYQ